MASRTISASALLSARGPWHRNLGRALLICSAGSLALDAAAQAPVSGSWSIVPFSTYTPASRDDDRDKHCAAFARCDMNNDAEPGYSGDQLLRAVGIELGALRDASDPELNRLYGAAVQYHLSPQWSLSADWTQFRVKAGEERSDVVYSVGTKYRF